MEAQTKSKYGTVRVTVHYSGEVRGGFCDAVEDLSEGYYVRGYVKPRRDGTTELVAEGAPQEVENFLDEIKKQLGDRVHNAERHEGLATLEFPDFSIHE